MLSLLRRVAEEMGVTLGGLVGYNVRFDDKTSPQTRVTFLTDGMLVRECMVNPTLKNYKVIILDEAHERSVHTDILCALVANVQRTSRPDLKILIMSATLSSDLFEKYFKCVASPLLLLPSPLPMLCQDERIFRRY
jgi:HrpA-like RNA helicase